MLKFCYDPEKPELLEGLALAVLADGRLHTFGKTDRKWVFVATQEQRNIFASQPHWFLDPKFCEATELSPKTRGPVRRMSIKDFIDALGLVLGERTNVQYIDKDPAEKDGPADEWLVALFSYLAKVPHGELADIHTRPILRNLCVIPEELSKSDFIRCSDGHYRAAGRLYLPPAKVAIDVLGEAARTPCTKTYADFDASWADFFRKCGVAVLPRPQDILNRVKDLSSSASGSDRRKALFKVLKCLADELEHYSTLALPSGELLLQALKGIEWLPAFIEDKPKDNPAFTAPSRELFHSKDVYPREMLPLVGNVHPVLAEVVELKLRDALGVPRAPALDDVCRQLERMSERIRHQSLAPKNIRGLSAAFDAIYQYFGRDAAGPHPTTTILSKRFEQIPCLFDKNGRLWLAKHAFANDYPCFGGRRLHFPTSDSTVAKGVDRLGRRPYPGLSDYVDFVDEVASDYKHQELPLAEASKLLDVYAAIAPQLGDKRLSPNTPLLTGSLKLYPAATCR